MPFSAQLINVMAALLLLIAFFMLSQRRILSLIHLYAWQGVVLAANVVIVGYSTGQSHLYYSAALTFARTQICSRTILLERGHRAWPFVGDTLSARIVRTISTLSFVADAIS